MDKTKKQLRIWRWIALLSLLALFVIGLMYFTGKDQKSPQPDSVGTAAVNETASARETAAGETPSFEAADAEETAADGEAASWETVSVEETTAEETDAEETAADKETAAGEAIDYAQLFPSWNPDSASLKELVDLWRISPMKQAPAISIRQIGSLPLIWTAPSSVRKLQSTSTIA